MIPRFSVQEAEWWGDASYSDGESQGGKGLREDHLCLNCHWFEVRYPGMPINKDLVCS